MIVKLQYSAATPATPVRLREDLKQMILGTMTTTTVDSVVRPSNLNADSSTTVVYGTPYTNANSIYANTDSGVRYYTKVHSVYSGVTNWFGFGVDTTYMTAELGTDDSDKSIKVYSNDMTTFKAVGAISFYAVITDTTVALFGQGTGGGDGFLYTDIAKNSLSLSFTDTSTIVAGIYDATTHLASPWMYAPKNGFYKTFDGLGFFATPGTPPLWDSSLNKHKFCLNQLTIGSEDTGVNHSFGIYALDNYPSAQGYAIMMDENNVPYLHTGRASITSLYAGVVIKGE